MSYRIKCVNNMNSFRIEDYRHQLAVTGRLKEFKRTYLGQLEEIPNRNSAKKWDTMNDLELMSFKEHPMAFERSKFVANRISRGSRVLDIGSGPGNLESFLSRKNVDLVGIDISSKSIKKAKEMFPQYKFIIGNFLDANLINREGFHYVVAMEVLEHISPTNTFKFIVKVKQLLKNRGIFIVSVPLNEGLEAMIKKGINPNAHVRVYTPAILETELILSGFRVIQKKFLYAFHRNYRLKTFLANKLGFLGKSPNIVIVIAEKL